MKKIFVLIILSVVFIKGNAQVMQAKAVWLTIAVPQMKCWECSTHLEKYLLHEKGPANDAGIIRWIINMSAANIRIQYYPDRITSDYLRASIANAGFDADTVKATPDSYKLIPNICKRTTEGGGPPKGVPCKLPPSDRGSLMLKD